MLSHISITVALAVGFLLVAIGILVAPSTALGGLAIALVVAAGTFVHARESSDSRSTTAVTRCRQLGLTAGAGTLAAWLLITGLVTLLGPVSGVILLSVLLPALGIWLWWRVAGRFAWSTTVGGRRRRLGLQPPSAPPAELSTKALCLAWQHSQHTLLEARTARARSAIVLARQQLLDEMERRDSAGFERWLATGACGTDPGGYLTTD